jgi:hypothetical protein
MSYRVKGILAAIAISAGLGAVQFASGHDLTVGLRTAGLPTEEVNRTAKTDREAVARVSNIPTRTIALHLDRLPDTSILIRVPLIHEARNTTPAVRFVPKGGQAQRAAVACEPVVSVLTDVAKLLQPGRCVT